MISDSNQNMELEQLRKILLGPMEETNEARDKKILDFIKAETAATAQRLDQIEARLNKISAAVEDERRSTLAEVGDAITELGQHLTRQAGERQPEFHEPELQSVASGGNLRESVVRILK